VGGTEAEESPVGRGTALLWVKACRRRGASGGGESSEKIRSSRPREKGEGEKKRGFWSERQALSSTSRNQRRIRGKRSFTGNVKRT